MKYILFGLLFLYITSNASAQNILTDYFNGDKDNLVAEAIKLIQMPEPPFQLNENPPLPDPQTIADMGFEQVYKSESRYFTARDNKLIFACKFPNQSPNTIIIIHGVASSAYLFNKTAGLLREATGAEVYAIDLRGHGQSEGNIGDVDYINQYVDDLADIIGTVRKEKPNGNIIIAGHSMGGGIALRYAMEKQLEQPDGFLLFAPLIGHNSPAIPHKQPENKYDEEPFMKIHIERIIGLKMLNEIGNNEYDSLPVLFFNLPETVPLRKYSHRANVSMAPDDYVKGLKALNKSTLVLIGSDDEAFNSEILQKTILGNSIAEVQTVDGTSHNGVRHHQQSFTFIKNWFIKL